MTTQLDVLVVGSVNIDMVVSVSDLPAPGTTVTGGTFDRHGGGKGANQAVAAARLGARVGLIAAVGDGTAGAEAVAELAREGVDVSHVVLLVDAETGVALIVVDDRGENQIAVASGANSRLDAGMVESALDSIELTEDGICLIGYEVGDDAIEAAAGWASSRGHRIVLDPAPARPMSATLTAFSPIVTPNAGEAAVLSGEGDPARAVAVLARMTSSPALVTLGSDGVVVADRDSIHRIPAFAAAVVDTTGAGDAFSGALAVGLSESRPLMEAVERGQAAAALSTQRKGARNGMPSGSAVDEFITEASSADASR